MITWHVVVDDFGEYISVTEINYPNKRYFTRVTEPFYPVARRSK